MVDYREPGDLEPHPLNSEIYVGERDEGGLLGKIEEHGFDEHQRLLVKPDGTILGGHRRWRAAQEVGLGKVPVEVVEPEDEIEEKRILLTDNDYREKTPAEVVNEGELWEQIERERAKERMSEGGGGKSSTPSGQGKTRDKVGESVGVSGKTWEKGKKVKETANDPNAPDEVRETAEEVWEKLKTGGQSIHGAHEAVEKEKERHKRAERRKARHGSISGEVSLVDDLPSLPDLDKKEVIFPFPGSKKQFSHWIISKMPPHRIYVEPFGGGASVLQTKPPSPTEIYNDLDADMANFFEVLSDNPAELQTRLQPVDFTEKQYDEWTRPFYEGAPIDDDIKAAAVFFFSRYAQWGGKHGGIGGFNEDKREKYHRKRARIPEFADRFEDVEVRSSDYSDILSEYDGPYTLHYMDPPYIGAEAQYQEGGDFDHDEFAERIAGLEGKWIVSYGEEIPDALEGYRQEEIEVTRALTSGKASVERLIMNYPESEEGAYKDGEWVGHAGRSDWE